MFDMTGIHKYLSRETALWLALMDGGMTAQREKDQTPTPHDAFNEGVAIYQQAAFRCMLLIMDASMRNAVVPGSALRDAAAFKA